MSSPAIYRFRRREIERRIEEFIALLDLIDGDPDLELPPISTGQSA